MSLGSRIIKRGSAVNVASLPTPREPLLFLYPQWIKTSPHPAPKLAYARECRPTQHFARNYTTHPVARRNFATETRTGKHLKTALFEDNHYVPSQRVDSQNFGDTLAAEDKTSVATAEAKVPNEKPTSNQTLVAHPRTNAKETLLMKSSSHLESNVNKALQAQAKARGSMLRNRAVRKAYQAERRERMKSWIPDWRVILAQLRKYTPQNDEWLERAIYISALGATAENFLNGVDDNLWDIAARYDSSVELANRKSDAEPYVDFLISGSATAIQKTAREVVRIAPDATLKAGPQAVLSTNSKTATKVASVSTEDLSACDDPVRFVRSHRRQTVLCVRPEKLPKPARWTTHTFAEYVNDLTSMKMPSYLHKLWYKKEEAHVKAVSRALQKAFSNLDCRSSLSRAAFNQAIAFYVKANQITDARALFVLMEMMEIPTDPETFNIFLRGAAKQEDLHVFQFVLDLMLRRGILPNGQTWIAFLMANYDFRIKAYIVSAMKEKGLITHPSTLKGVCEQVISQEISTSLDQGQSQEDFLRHMDHRYGNKWLTVDSGNRVLHVLGSRHLISRCWEFLEAMDARQITPNQVSINTIVNHCKQAGNVHGAIEIMERLPSLFNYVPDEHTYHALFELAWRTRNYNFAKVTWKYACLNAGTTRRMRLLVRQSLLNGAQTSTTETSQYLVWKRQAGLIITSDVDHHPTTKVPQLVDEETALPDPEVEKLGGSSETLGMRQVVDRLVERDQQVFIHWIPTRAFGDMLMEAWERDCLWRNVRVDSERASLGWKLREAISVPLRSRGR